MPRSPDVRPEPLDLPIRYLDPHLVVVAKPAGMATHPGPGWWSGSCVNALLHAVSDWPGVGGVAGPGIVHRLDRDTSGLLVFARSDEAHRALLHAAAARGLERTYLAWVRGEPAEAGTIDRPIAREPEGVPPPRRSFVDPAGKPAVTHWRVLARVPGRSLLALTLETGRNHQIRVHMAHMGHPVSGDGLYGDGGGPLALHAWRLAFRHPVTGLPLAFVEPPPLAFPDRHLAPDAPS